MADPKPIDIINDNPERESVMFGFEAYAKTIAGVIANRKNDTPLVIGIYGSWGAGKTTLMEATRKLLKGKAYEDKKLFRQTKSVWFQAWKYGKEEEILAALIEEIFKTMKTHGFFEACKAEIEKLASELKPSKVIGSVTKLLTGQDITEFFGELEYKEKLGFYDTFQEFFDRLLWTYLRWRPKRSHAEQTDDQAHALVIFIDDLDRCPPGKIVRVLETVKLFMDKKGCVFVLGAAREIIEKALAVDYGEDAGKFMDKIVQVSFNLPRIREEEFQAFVEKISPRINEQISPHLHLFVPAMQNNPRQLKRFLNNLSLQSGIIAHKKELDIDFNALLYWSIIEYVYPSLWGELKENPLILSTLQEHIRTLEKQMGGKGLRELSDDALKEVPRSLHGYLRMNDLREIVKHFTGSPKEIQSLASLSAITESEEVKKAADDKAPATFDDMADVPVGAFIYGFEKEKKEIAEPFKIDIYPVTNEQYARFMDAGGYTGKNYWSKEGLEFIKKEKISQPKYWEDEKWNQHGHPVVGVSFFEAQAYAKWAGKRLTTEIEWERAARGTDGREFPWGEKFDKEKCNTVESSIGRTSRVNRFPNGVSPVGCYDMAGNVWEWTSSDYDEKDKVLRGGSWDDSLVNARCANRIRDLPGIRNYLIGFRCVRT